MGHERFERREKVAFFFSLVKNRKRQLNTVNFVTVEGQDVSGGAGVIMDREHKKC